MSFILRSDARARVLAVIFGKIVTDRGFLAGFAAVRDFVKEHGPHHGITDFSGAESVEISNDLLTQIGAVDPAFPIPMRRIVVASTPATYVCAPHCPVSPLRLARTNRNHRDIRQRLCLTRHEFHRPDRGHPQGRLSPREVATQK
jgi:hypothetical protein